MKIYRPKYVSVENPWHLALVPWVAYLDGQELRRGENDWAWANARTGEVEVLARDEDGRLIEVHEEGSVVDVERVVKRGVVEIEGKTVRECVTALCTLIKGWWCHNFGWPLRRRYFGIRARISRAISP